MALPQIPGVEWAEGTIYYIGSAETGRMKIGYTAGDPVKRLRALQTGSPTKLALFAMHPGTQELEQKLHNQFADARLHGEWFDASDELLIHLASVCALTIALSKRIGEDPPSWATIGLKALQALGDDEVGPTIQ